MRLQIISDIHLEFRDNNYPYIARTAPNIALIGDIGRPFSSVYRRLIANLAKRFEHVILLAGNHEYYSSPRRKITVAEIKERIRAVAGAYDNVHFLDNTAMFIDGTRILGCTLWTRIPPEQWVQVRKEMNDYRMCFVSRFADLNLGVPLAPEHTVYWHEESLQWLKEELSAPGYLDTPTVVLTHHAPYDKGTSDPQYDSSPTRACYATDLSAMFRAPIVAWAYGHTHWPQDSLLNGVRLISNPLGYPGELGEQNSLENPPLIIT